MQDARPQASYRPHGERISELRGKGLGKLKIARTLGCGVSTVQRVLAA
jgi:hypothetical protein